MYPCAILLWLQARMWWTAHHMLGPCFRQIDTMRPHPGSGLWLGLHHPKPARAGDLLSQKHNAWTGQVSQGSNRGLVGLPN